MTLAVSPDGHWLAYVSDESGRYEIYVQQGERATTPISVVLNWFEDLKRRVPTGTK